LEDGIARMGEVVFSGPNLTVLRALGLGSCIGMCVFDPASKLGCLAHIMLPESRGKGEEQLGKYADTAVPFVIDEMVRRGSNKSKLCVAMAGGAQLFSFEGASDRMDVGRRNTEAVKQFLASSRVRICAEDVGGKFGRTLVMDTTTGAVVVKVVGGNEFPLARLG
jgi:chemotaxis protein CheD